MGRSATRAARHGLLIGLGLVVITGGALGPAAPAVADESSLRPLPGVPTWVGRMTAQDPFADPEEDSVEGPVADPVSDPVEDSVVESVPAQATPPPVPGSAIGDAVDPFRLEEKAARLAAEAEQARLRAEAEQARARAEQERARGEREAALLATQTPGSSVEVSPSPAGDSGHPTNGILASGSDSASDPVSPPDAAIMADPGSADGPAVPEYQDSLSLKEAHRKGVLELQRRAKQVPAPESDPDRLNRLGRPTWWQGKKLRRPGGGKFAPEVRRWANMAKVVLIEQGLPRRYLKGVLARIEAQSGGRPRSEGPSRAGAERVKGLMLLTLKSYRRNAKVGLGTEAFHTHPYANVYAGVHRARAKHGLTVFEEWNAGDVSRG